MNFTLYAIYALAGMGAELQVFDRPLPFEIVQGVHIEHVSTLIQNDAFDIVKQRMGLDAVEKLRHVTHAVVHRYNPQTIIDPETNQIVGEQHHSRSSEQLIRNLAACMRLIRPMRQTSEMMWGRVRENGTFDVLGFNHPVDLTEVPENQKLFSFHNEDADDLRSYAPEFLRAMNGDFWKFRMAVQFHELGHWQELFPKARYLLWASAIEAIYTSHGSEHKGSRVAKERIKWFLGERTSIYPAGELSDLIHDPQITLGDIVDPLYAVRNYIAHGDRIPDRFFEETLRDGLNGRVSIFAVLFEAESFIIRQSLLKILRDNLLEHFVDADSSEAFFAANGLTRTAIRTRQQGSTAAVDP